MPPHGEPADDQLPGEPEAWGRRVAIVLLGLVAAGVLLAGVLVVVLRVVVDEAVGALELADLDDYEVRFTSCSPDVDGTILAIGIVTNTADDTRSFEVRLLAEIGDDTTAPTTLVIDALPSGDSVRFDEPVIGPEPAGASAAEVRCRAVVYDRTPG